MNVRIGLALGSGSARGWAHIGVLRALVEEGITPQVVSGTSIGALVGAAYACGKLQALEKWVCTLTWRDVVRFMDVDLLRGGFIQGERLMLFFQQYLHDRRLEELPCAFGAVATDLVSGREVWLLEGSMMQAVRASIALPGLFSPVKQEGRWLVDGGLVNPVPVSLCRALGAEIVIAVNLNGDLLGRHLKVQPNHARTPKGKAEEELFRMISQGVQSFKKRAKSMFPKLAEVEERPSLFDVLAGSINIMQDRITRSRMAGDPAEWVFCPRVGYIGLLEFDRAREAIEAGYVTVKKEIGALRESLSL